MLGLGAGAGGPEQDGDKPNMVQTATCILMEVRDRVSQQEAKIFQESECCILTVEDGFTPLSNAASGPADLSVDDSTHEGHAEYVDRGTSKS